MYERMLNKQATPTIEEMTEFCGENAERFSLLNEWLTSAFHTEQKIVFPYGNHYGWGIAHKKKNKLICNIFSENNAFTVMMRLSDKQYNTIYNQLNGIIKFRLIGQLSGKDNCPFQPMMLNRLLKQGHCIDKHFFDAASMAA